MKNNLSQFFLCVMGIIVIAFIPVILYMVHVIME